MCSLFLPLFVILLGASSIANAGTKELPDDLKKTLGIEKLPPVENRKIVGTWFSKDIGCTRSFEQVSQKYFEVMRCKDDSGGADGSPLSKINSNTFRPLPPRRTGDHYVIKNNGDLEARDNEGLIETLPKSADLRPRPAPLQPQPKSSGQSVKKELLACTSEDALDEAFTYANKKDFEGIKQLMLTGNCIVLKEGDPVSVISPGFMTATIRYRGVKLYTPSEAVR
ncbi:hypothetical protein [Propionivibrio sp.]|uniref:hypothetical protein n=1 Tax=Propionivibrio sp. TaxID=2212460 RepID=UPI0039E5C251